MRTRGQSEMIAYVLLIVIAVAMSILVYKYMKSYVPSEGENCPEGANLVVRSYSCDNRTHVMYLELENKGLFSVDGFKIRGSNDSTKELATRLLGNGAGGAGYYTFSEEIKPGSRETQIIELSYLVNKTKEYFNDLSFIEVLPSIFDSGKSTLCSNAKIKQKIVCDYDDSLKMWLKFDGTTYDATKNYNNGNCDLSKKLCPTLVSGIVSSDPSVASRSTNRAYYFNGSQYLTVLNSDSLNFGMGNFTIGMWINDSLPNHGTRALVDKTNGAYSLTMLNTGSLTNFVLYAGGVRIDIPTSYNLADSMGHQIAFTGDRKRGVTLYIDGISRAFIGNLPGGYGTLGDVGNMNSESNLTIGSNTNNNLGFNGTIDDVRIYNRVLSAEEINSIFRNGP